MTTPELFAATLAALTEQRWSAARALLDDLAQRPDHRQALADAATFGLTGPYLPVIQDRIELANSVAERNAPRFAVGDRVSCNHRVYFVVGVDTNQPAIAYWLDDDRDGIGVLFTRADHCHRA